MLQVLNIRANTSISFRRRVLCYICRSNKPDKYRGTLHQKVTTLKRNTIGYAIRLGCLANELSVSAVLFKYYWSGTGYVSPANSESNASLICDMTLEETAHEI